MSQSNFIYSLRIDSCSEETNLLKSRFWFSSGIAHKQLAALYNVVSVIVEASLAVVANFSLLESRFFNN
jgi:hypothetical protein